MKINLAMMHRQTLGVFIAPLAILMVCNLLLLTPAPLVLQSWAAVGLGVLLPGLLLTAVLLAHHGDRAELEEYLIFGVGMGYVLLVLIMLGLSYLPGGLTFWQVMSTFTLIVIVLTVGLGVISLRSGERAVIPMVGMRPTRWLRSIRWPAIALVVLMIGAGYLRFTHLAYSELHGDEALVALRAVDVIQGWERGLFVHKKGPGEILIGAAMYRLTGGLTEYTAHLPFALASWTGVLAVYSLGRRWFGPVAGWWAGAMVAVDGYLMAFGRMLQYQSIIFLLVVLTVLAMQCAFDRRQATTRYLLMAAFLLATGLLVHYEAAIAAVPALWLLIALWHSRASAGLGTTWQLARQIAIALLVGTVILASFYVPYIRDPEFFRDTYAYIFGYRLAGQTVPDGLAIIVGRSTLYSSSYYFWLLVGLTGLGLLHAYQRYTPVWLRIPLVLLLVSVLGALLIDSAAFFRAPGRLGLLLFLMLFAPVWFAARVPLAERTAWLWFGAPLTGILFFVIKPGTHVYIFFIPWALVAGMIVGQGWAALVRYAGRTSRFTHPRWLLAPLMVLLVLLFGNYVRWLFVVNNPEVLRTWDENRPTGYWTSYTTPAFESIFGFPIRNGWKTVAALYDQGVLHGRFDTNDRFSMVPDWYLRGKAYCPRDNPRYYLLVPHPLPVDRPLVDNQRRQLADSYYLWGTVTVNQQPHMEIYARRDRVAAEQAGSPRRLPAEAYTDHFNHRLLAPFTRNGPLGTQPIPFPTAYRFGEHIELLGYHVDSNQVIPGGEAAVELYWTTAAPLDVNYFVSIQIINLVDAHKVGQRDGEPGCNRFPTTSWVAGDRLFDRYHVPIAQDAQPGDYTLYVTMYEMNAADGAQSSLPVMGSDGQLLSGAALTTITVTE